MLSEGMGQHECPGVESSPQWQAKRAGKPPTEGPGVLFQSKRGLKWALTKTLRLKEASKATMKGFNWSSHVCEDALEDFEDGEQGPSKSREVQVRREA